MNEQQNQISLKFFKEYWPMVVAVVVVVLGWGNIQSDLTQHSLDIMELKEGYKDSLQDISDIKRDLGVALERLDGIKQQVAELKK